MDIRVTHSAPPATAQQTPDFPVVRFDTGMVVYQEALIDGQYLFANASAMGRPRSRDRLWKELSGDVASVRPLRTRQHAFQLEIDGQLLVDRWAWVDAHEPEAGRAACRESVVILEHTQRPVWVEVHTRLDDTPFLVRSLRITNTGDRPAALARISPWSGLLWQAVPSSWNPRGNLPGVGHAPFSLGRFTETSWGAEGSFDWMALPGGAYGLETLHGRSGWGAPFCIVRNETTGEMVVAHLAWSGNWRINFWNDYEAARRPEREARLYAEIGLGGPAPLRVLDPGESTHTPEVHVGFLWGDLDAGVQALHQHQRRSVVLPQPPGREHRIEINHTGYTRNVQVTQRQLFEEIELAADLGVELFMLDAGWFGAASDRWFEAVGDWDEESPLLPGGVGTIFEHARARGLLCGLWVEAERMGPASRLLREHPDWQMRKRGDAIPNLDLSRPEVAAYLEQTITDLIERYQLDCFRLDYNISVGEGGEREHGGYTENLLWRYYDALYGIFDRVHQRFPQLLLENCSSGDGRTDLGMMSRVHWTQISDEWAPAPTLKILNGLTLALPPELCESALGAISEGVADLDFMLRVGLFGHFTVSGIFPSMDERHLAAHERWRHAFALYKSFVRALLPGSRMFHHTPIQRQTEPGDWVVLECAGEDRSRAYAGIFRLARPALEPSAAGFHLYPRGLDPARRYRVVYDSTSIVREVDGGVLLDQGLRVQAPGAYTSELLLFEEIT